MKFNEIKEIIQLVNDSDLSEIKLENGDFKLIIRTKEYVKGKNMAPMVSVQPQMQMAQPPVAPAATAPVPAVAGETKDAPEKEYLEVRSPIVGTFYRASAPEKPPYIKVGDVINVGDTVCIVEAMKLFNEIESEVSGRVVKVMVEDTHPVQYDQVLFLVEPN